MAATCFEKYFFKAVNLCLIKVIIAFFFNVTVFRVQKNVCKGYMVKYCLQKYSELL